MHEKILCLSEPSDRRNKKKKKKWVAASDVGLPARTGSLSRLRLSFGILRTPVNQIVRNWNLYACLYRK